MEEENQIAQNTTEDLGKNAQNRYTWNIQNEKSFHW